MCETCDTADALAVVAQARRVADALDAEHMATATTRKNAIEASVATSDVLRGHAVSDDDDGDRCAGGCGMTDEVTCDVCTASSDWVCRRCYDALSREQEAAHERCLAAELRARGRTDAADAEESALRRVLTGLVNDAIIVLKARVQLLAVEEGRRSKPYRTAVWRLDELRDAHNKLQSLQVDYSHARMLLHGWVQSRRTGDVGDEEFFLRRAREYFEVRE